MTAAIDAPVTMEPSWGMADMRAVAIDAAHASVDGAVPTSKFGAHIDYVYAPALRP